MNSMICPYCGKLIAYNSYFDVFYCSKCGGFFKQATVMECNDLNKPLTNAQKIRAMSDEELAKLLCCTGWRMFEQKECLEWLQRPAGEEDKHEAD